MLLISIGLSGFLLQVLITEGLQRERAGRATNMIVSILVSIVDVHLANVKTVHAVSLRSHHRSRCLAHDATTRKPRRGRFDHRCRYLGRFTEEGSKQGQEGSGSG